MTCAVNRFLAHLAANSMFDAHTWLHETEAEWMTSSFVSESWATSVCIKELAGNAFKTHTWLHELEGEGAQLNDTVMAG